MTTSCVIEPRPADELIVGNRQELKARVLEALEHGERHIVIDFTRTKYIDSSGLGVLLTLHRYVRDASGTLTLRNLNKDLSTLFELTRMDTLFDYECTEESPQ
jgi:anti-sigma B factor antagonist